MKRRFLLIAIIFLSAVLNLKSQIADSADVYLLTCAPGTETYSIYGHTALRIAIRGTGFDRVYNWGIFDFTTPHFAYRFAKGKLDYMLGAYDYTDFLNEYVTEERSVWSQKINLTTADKKRLFLLINENLKPENIKYRYNFFYDNCSTRVRDILEKSISDSIDCQVPQEKVTFRQLIDQFQGVMPWIDLGADMLLGLQADRKASAREEMFLPLYLKSNMSEWKVIRNNISVKLLDAPQTVVDFPKAEVKKNHHFITQMVFYAALVLVILITYVLGFPLLKKGTDLLVYSAYSVLALLLIFTNLFSEHDALHYNLLILAFNPLLPFLLISLLRGKKAINLNRAALAITVFYFPVALIAGQGINPAIIPLVLILIVCIFRHCEFGKAF